MVAEGVAEGVGVSKSSKRKGSGGELEVAAILRDAGFPNASRTPYSGADSRWAGDVMGVDGWTIEIKRTERLDLYGSLRQVYAAARGGNQPALAFRRNASPWHVVVPLEEWARLVHEQKVLP
jgi:Holliday junction resolvase